MVIVSIPPFGGIGAGLADKLGKSLKDNSQSLAMRTSSL